MYAAACMQGCSGQGWLLAFWSGLVSDLSPRLGVQLCQVVLLTGGCWHHLVMLFENFVESLHTDARQSVSDWD